MKKYHLHLQAYSFKIVSLYHFCAFIVRKIIKLYFKEYLVRKRDITTLTKFNFLETHVINQFVKKNNGEKYFLSYERPFSRLL